MNRGSPPKYPKGIQWLLPWVFRQKQAESVGVTFKKMYKKFNSSKSLIFSHNFKLLYICLHLVTLSVTSGQTLAKQRSTIVDQKWDVDVLSWDFYHKNHHKDAIANFFDLDVWFRRNFLRLQSFMKIRCNMKKWALVTQTLFYSKSIQSYTNRLFYFSWWRILAEQGLLDK